MHFLRIYHFQKHTLSNSELSQLKRICSSLYPSLVFEDDSLNSVCKKYSYLHYSGLRYTIVYTTNSSSIAQRSLTNPGAIDLKPRPVILKNSFFIRTNITTHGRTQGGFGGFGRTPPPATGKGPLLHSLVVVYHSRTLHGSTHDHTFSNRAIV